VALSRVTTWSSGQVLTASALNGEIDNILNNGADLVFPLTEAADLNGQVLQNLAAGAVGSPGFYFNADSDTGAYRSAANTFDLAVGGVQGLSVTSVTGASSYLLLNHGAVTIPEEVSATATGTATNITVRLAAKGTGYLIVPTGSSAGANYLPGVAITGDEGTGVARLASGTISLLANSREVLRASGYASATNYLQITPSSTGSPVVVAAAGGDTDIDLRLDAKGAGLVRTATGFASVAFGGANPPPANALYRDNTCVAWANLTGSSGAIGAGHGVSSITRHAAGEYTANLFTAMAATPYGVFGLAQSPSAAVSHLLRREGSAQTTTSCRFITITTTGTPTEGAEVCVFFMGKQ